jgi:hypothetical protein
VEVVEGILGTFMIIEANESEGLPQLHVYLGHHTRNCPIFRKFILNYFVELFLLHVGRKLFYEQVAFLGYRVSLIPVLEYFH